MHCRRFIDVPATRRQLLQQSAGGFGALALAGLMTKTSDAVSPASVPRPHSQPKARSVIFLYMDGGPSQVDTFDPKPRLTAEHGQPFKMKMEPTQFNDNGLTLGSPWKFARHGECGSAVSELFPCVAKCVDDLAIVRSMTSEFSEHTSANYLLHTGAGVQGRPSVGAWTLYGLGSECDNLPGFVVLNGGLIPPGGIDNFGSGYLPANCQASLLRPEGEPVANFREPSTAREVRLAKSDLRSKLDRAVAERYDHADAIEAAILNYELAFRMQSAVPELIDLSTETAATKRMYGMDDGFAPTRTFATECLIARRLVERGVRFIELTCPTAAADRWDQHNKLLEGHQNNARAVDQPIAALLTDLKTRGLLDETVVWWGGEFGRTPFAQGSDGRDHNPFGFSCWLAGGGVRGGTVYGATDEYGYKAIEDRVNIHDLHATMFHLLGIDHERLTYRYGGRDMRLTDVWGRIILPLLA